jgi:hypothetical protein
VEENSRMADEARSVKQRANPATPSVRLESIVRLVTNVEESCHQGRTTFVNEDKSAGSSKRVTCYRDWC